MKLFKKNLCFILMLMLITLTFASCGGGDSDNAAGEITVTDQIGRTVTLPEPADNIVSSYYISTALLIELDCEDNIAGIEKKADTRELYKLAAPQLLDLPAIGSGKGINVEECAKLEPDLVIIPKKLQDNVKAFEDLGIPVIVVDPETQENYEECISILAQATGKQDRGEKLLDYYHKKTDEIKKITEDLDKPSVYLSAGSQYLSTCTSKMYQNELISMAGGKNVSQELTDGYWQNISPEQLASWNPEYWYVVNYAEYSIDDIRKDAAVKDVAAVKNNKITTFPSEIESWDYPAPSSILGVMWLTNQLHPEEYDKKTYIKEAKNFYKEFFDIDVTEEQLGV